MGRRGKGGKVGIKDSLRLLLLPVAGLGPGCCGSRRDPLEGPLQCDCSLGTSLLTW